MTFLNEILCNLSKSAEKPILQEVGESQLKTVTNSQLLTWINEARKKIKLTGLLPGNRCVLLGNNSSHWVAINLAIMAEGGIVVPLYPRQASSELISMMRDCSPTLLCCADESFSESLTSPLDAPPQILKFSEILTMSSKLKDQSFNNPDSSSNSKQKLTNHTNEENNVAKDRVVTIIYTSGTSGEPKGVMLSDSNITFMLQRTTARLEELMENVVKTGDDRVFHYLPFCFAGSWILLLTCLYRNNCLMLSTDLNQIAQELSVSQPHYLLNVPALLERIQTRVSNKIQEQGGIGFRIFRHGKSAWLRQQNNEWQLCDSIWLFLARSLVFSKIKKKLGLNLRALICGSAPLSKGTQFFFQMIGIPVLQVYGLTETTAICTMDNVNHTVAGQVGPAISGIEMALSSNQEILVRGPNVFPGYWNRREATDKVLQNGWFHTGDQGEIDKDGNWKIVGRVKNIIITTSGHNISPEPLERKLETALPQSDQVFVVGNSQKYLSAIITGKLNRELVEQGLKKINQELPHYQQIIKYHLTEEPFSIENGLLAANGKVRRSAVENYYQSEIKTLYNESKKMS